jgi:hypothetical protein
MVISRGEQNRHKECKRLDSRWQSYNTPTFITIPGRGRDLFLVRARQSCKCSAFNLADGQWKFFTSPVPFSSRRKQTYPSGDIRARSRAAGYNNLHNSLQSGTSDASATRRESHLTATRILSLSAAPDATFMLYMRCTTSSFALKWINFRVHYRIGRVQL